MKKLIVMTVVCLFASQYISAQVKKGNVLISGAVGFQWDKDETADYSGKTTALAFSPKAGYALADNWVAGVFVSGVFSKSESDAGKIKTNSIAPGIFVRHYTMLGEKIGLYGDASAYYAFGASKTADVKTSDFNTFSIQVRPGISYFVTRRFLLEGEFGGLTYAHSEYDNASVNEKGSTNAFSFSFAEEFTLGVAFLF